MTISLFQNLHPDMEHKCSICSSRVGLYKSPWVGRKNYRWGSGYLLPWVNIWMKLSKITFAFWFDEFLCSFQELSLRPDNYIFDTLMCGEDNWTRHCRTILGRMGYIKMRSLRLLGMSINIFVKRKHFVHVRDLEWNYRRFDVKKSVSIKKWSGISKKKILILQRVQWSDLVPAILTIIPWNQLS